MKAKKLQSSALIDLNRAAVFSEKGQHLEAISCARSAIFKIKDVLEKILATPENVEKAKE